MQMSWRRAMPAWAIDVVQSYNSVAVFFDLNQIRFDLVSEHLQSLARSPEVPGARPPGRLHEIPCCYEFQLDLDRVAEHTGRSADEIIHFHSATEYTVYAIGFCPGFPYLGYLPPQLCGVPRLSPPRLRVEAGSVGLAGLQTGIYTEVRPGGWNVLGRTPLELVNVADSYFPIRTGHRVRFHRVDDVEFQRLVGERLEFFMKCKHVPSSTAGHFSDGRGRVHWRIGRTWVRRLVGPLESLGQPQV